MATERNSGNDQKMRDKTLPVEEQWENNPGNPKGESQKGRTEDVSTSGEVAKGLRNSGLQENQGFPRGRTRGAGAGMANEALAGEEDEDLFESMEDDMHRGAGGLNRGLGDVGEMQGEDFENDLYDDADEGLYQEDEGDDDYFNDADEGLFDNTIPDRDDSDRSMSSTNLAE